jgi:tetratricopeptide (TPR) repeat protein
MSPTNGRSSGADPNDHELRLIARGRHRDAREHLDEAVRLYRLEPSAGAPPEFELAAALHNRAKCLTELGLLHDARQDARDAVAIWRRCAKIDRESVDPLLAPALSQLAALTRDVRPRRAAKLAQEAVVISRRVVEASFDAQSSDDPADVVAATYDREMPPQIMLAMALNNLSLCLWHADRQGQRMQRAAAITEAVSIYQSSARENKVWEPLLAEALDNLGPALQAVGRPAEALDAARKSVALYKKLSASHTADLAGALFNLSNHLDIAGLRDEAIQRMEQVVQAYRELATREPARYEPDLERAKRALEELRHGRSPLDNRAAR